VVDAGHVDELEGAPEALRPPPELLCAVRRPVIERVAPELAVGVEVVGRRSGLTGLVEQRRMFDRVGAATGDVDRKVADDPDAALGSVGAKCGPLALEANLVGEGALPREPLPARRPVRVTVAEALDLGRLDLGVRVGEEPVPGGERRGGGVRGAVPVRRDEREDLPPALAGGREPVDETLRLSAEPSARERRRMEKDAGGPVQRRPVV
jgi:hypothetical protein